MQVAFVSLVLAALTSQAFAVLFITSPTQGTSAQGGQPLNIAWMDNGTAPLLSDIGPCSIGLYVGNMQQQTELQLVSSSVDVSKQSSMSFTVDPTVGGNSNAYFIRFNSLGLKDPSNPQFNYEAFSGKFTLTGMSGQFNSTVQAQINGITSASSSGAATTAATSASLAAAKISTTTLPAAAQTAASSTGSSSAAKSTQKSSASSTRGSVGVLLSAISVIVGLVGLTL